MSEQVEVSQESVAQQPDVELQQRINQHLQDKAQLLGELVQLYSALTQKVALFNVPVHIKGIGLQYFDTGFLWIKEAIQACPIPAKAEAVAAQPEVTIEPTIDAA